MLLSAPSASCLVRPAGPAAGPLVWALMALAGDAPSPGDDLCGDQRRQAFLDRFRPEAFRILIDPSAPAAAPLGAIQVDRRGGRLVLRRLVAPPDGQGRRGALLQSAIGVLRDEARALGGDVAVQAPLTGQETQWLERMGFEQTGAGGGYVALADRASEDDRWMGQALAQGRLGGAQGEAPIGAVVVREGRLVAAAHNQPLGASDPTAHAEILALREAARLLGAQRLAGCALYVTVEPCAMCAGAMLHARIGRLVFGAPNAKFGAVQSVCALLDLEGWNHRVVWRGGARADEAAALMQTFFAERRG